MASVGVLPGATARGNPPARLCAGSDVVVDGRKALEVTRHVADVVYDNDWTVGADSATGSFKITDGLGDTHEPFDLQTDACLTGDARYEQMRYLLDEILDYVEEQAELSSWPAVRSPQQGCVA
jgi:hypothetical protein